MSPNPASQWNQVCLGCQCFQRHQFYFSISSHSIKRKIRSHQVQAAGGLGIKGMGKIGGQKGTLQIKGLPGQGEVVPLPFPRYFSTSRHNVESRDRQPVVLPVYLSVDTHRFISLQFSGI